MIFWVILSFFLYSLLGIMICDKLDVLYDTTDLLESLIDGIFIAFWPIVVLAHFLLDD